MEESESRLDSTNPKIEPVKTTNKNRNLLIVAAILLLLLALGSIASIVIFKQQPLRLLNALVIKYELLFKKETTMSSTETSSSSPTASDSQNQVAGSKSSKETTSGKTNNSNNSSNQNSSGNDSKNNSNNPTNPPSNTTPTTPVTEGKVKFLKDVGEAYMDYFGLTESDFQTMQSAGIKIIEGNYDICATDEDTQFFLDMSQKYGMKVVMPAGSGEAEWGYECNKEPFPSTQVPVWNKAGVVKWVNKWKDHPAVYGWDTSNEAGTVLPNADPDHPNQYMLSLDQIKQAYADVKAADPNHPIMIRMIGWYFYDYDRDFFRTGNPFDKNVADIVMINAYSNVEDYYADFVTTVTSRAISSIKSVDNHIQFFIALGSWQEDLNGQPFWYLPSVDHLQTESEQLRNYDILGVGYFKYGAKGSEWYMPDSTIGAPQLWQVIKNFSF